jgi:hypothetical protein
MRRAVFMRLAVFLAALCGAVLLSSSARAAFCWGTKEQLVHVRQLPINSPENRPLNLVRVLRMECLGLPYKIADAGYVMAAEGQQSYFPLSDDEIASFQSSRALPTPMPVFEMSMADWAKGHLLWWTAMTVLSLMLLPWGRLMPRRKPKPVPQPVRRRRPRPAQR